MKNKALYKWLAFLLAFVMILGLCACGKSEPAPTPEPTPEPTPAPPPEPTPEPTPEPIVGELLTDDDGDGIIQYKFQYKGATVYALIVLDPGRVYIGTALPEPSGWSGFGLTLDAMAEQYGAIAGINAGGFKDEGGGGEGWPPSGITYSNGVVFDTMQYGPIAGLDRDDHMWAGFYDFAECEGFGMRDAVCFGPALIINGQKQDPATMESGIGARTAIGQREDGAIVMVAIDGRQGYSIGVTFEDCISIMADKFGCVNAANMDGGNSTCMYFYGEAVNRSANQAGGTRYLPDAWLVNPLPDGYVKPESVPEQIVLPENPLGEVKEYASTCDEATSARLFDFASNFAVTYYAYFGTMNRDYYYYPLLQYVVPGSDLQVKIDDVYWDQWINTYNTVASNVSFKGAYVNGDGSYDILISSDVTEYSTYWTYAAEAVPLRITVVEAPESQYGYLAIETF